MRTTLERDDAPNRVITRAPETVRPVADPGRAISDVGIESSVATAAGVAGRAGWGPAQLRAAEVVQLQRVVGNAAVGALLGVAQRETDDGVQAVLNEEDEEEAVPAQLAAAAIQREEAGAAAAPPAASANLTGMPDGLKAGVEALSGLPMDDVRVHYDSPAPAGVEALAYAQGTDIHVAPGQERHLPHEAWHVVQQKQGRVQPTLDVAGIAVNDDPALEHEADVMGKRAMR